MDGCKSEVRTITAGIPQGSKLGPILFILYTNDIQKDIESEILLYSDDTSLLASGLSPIETSEKFNRDMAGISAWAKVWKIKFNADKSCDILFSNRRHPINPSILLNSETIKKVTEHKHLGIYLTSTLDWTKQVHEVCLKANCKLAVLRSIH